MEAWIGVITSFCLIIGCFGMIVVLFFWDETIVYCCTHYVHLQEEEDDTEQNNHVILQVGSGEIQAAQATTKRFLSSDSYTLRFAQV
jgi:hypothetical protein